MSQQADWRARRGLALAIDVAIYLLPIGVATLVAWVLTPAVGSLALFWRMLLVLSLSAGCALASSRVLRRLLPLTSLLRLTMAFPDRAPSRFKVARSAGNSRQLLERLQSRDIDESTAAENILALVAALSAHDKKTRGHSERVRAYADLLSEEMGLDKHARDRLRWAALLHDIGKLQVSGVVLNKPGKPNAEEWRELMAHPDHGARLAAPLLGWLGEWGAAIVEHHERYDGTGYPRGLAGTRISRAGRMVAVVDAFETMTSARSYKKAMTRAQAREELTRCAGSQFDPAIVKAFLRISLGRMVWVAGPSSIVAQLRIMQDVQTAAGAAAVGHIGTAVVGAATVATLGAAGPLAHTLPLENTPTGTHSAASAAKHPSASHRGGKSAVVDGNAAATGAAQSTGSGGGPGPVSATAPTGLDGSGPRSQGSGVPTGGAGGGSGGGGSTTSPAPGGGGAQSLSAGSFTVYVARNSARPVPVLSHVSGDPDASTVRTTSNPGHGSVTTQSDGSMSYTPAHDYKGTDSFVYQVCDDAGSCDSGTVTLKVLDPNEKNANLAGADLSGLNLQGYDFTGATLQGADLSNANVHNVHFNTANLRDATLANADASGANFDHADLNGTNFNGANVSGANLGQPPTTSDDNASTTIGHTVRINVLANDSDPDRPIDPASLTITHVPGHGTVVINADHTVTYTPTAGWHGNDQFTYSIANTLGKAKTANVRVTVS